jgi:hypothetical protein
MLSKIIVLRNPLHVIDYQEDQLPDDLWVSEIGKLEAVGLPGASSPGSVYIFKGYGGLGSFPGHIG